MSIEIENLLAQALQYLNADDDKNALRLYQQILEIDPRCLPALNGCGIVFGNMKNYQAAINSFTQVIEIDPEDGEFWLRALAHFRAGNFENALADSNRAIELAPDVPGHYRMKAEILISLQQDSLLPEVLACFEQVLRLEPNNADAQKKRAIIVDRLNQNRLQSQLLPSLYELKEQIEAAFPPFEEERTILDEDRADAVKVMNAISRQSTSLVENVSREDLLFEPLMLYHYIQAVVRGCNGVRFYRADNSKEMLSDSTDGFYQAEKFAEKLEDLRMLKDINWKRGTLIFALYKTWGVKNVLNVALDSYQWLDTHPNTINSDQKKLIQERLTQIQVVLTSSQSSNVSSSVSSNLDNSVESNTKGTLKDEKGSKHNLAWGIGAFGVILLTGGQYLIAIICLGVAWWLVYQQ